jgi:hypothetical protein
MPEIEPVKTVYPDIEYSEKKSHEIEHFESASKTEQVEVGVADRNRNVSAKYVIFSLPLILFTDIQNSKSSLRSIEGVTIQYFGFFLRRTWIQR